MKHAIHPHRRHFRTGPPKPKPYGAVIAQQRVDGETTISVTMSAREAAIRLGGQKGGRRSQELGTANRFTPETARRAAHKLWKKKQRKVWGYRIGCKKRRPKTARGPLRTFYLTHTLEGIKCVKTDTGYQWYIDERCIGERSALRRLGHLPYPNKRMVPQVIIPVIGMLPAQRRRREQEEQKV